MHYQKFKRNEYKFELNVRLQIKFNKNNYKRTKT
jgi:hypothetical protein